MWCSTGLLSTSTTLLSPWVCHILSDLAWWAAFHLSVWFTDKKEIERREAVEQAALEQAENELAAAEAAKKDADKKKREAKKSKKKAGEESPAGGAKHPPTKKR